MTEIELKFQVPQAARAALEAAVRQGRSRRTHLQAIYFDTPERHLAAAGIGLRLRKEGRRWVQTLKATDGDAMQRLEHNVPLVGDLAPPAGTLPPLEPTLHAGTPAGERLAAALAPHAGDDGPARLVPLYRTDIWRIGRELRAPGGAVELAFDQGAVVAEGRRWPVCELEIELLRGDAAVVIGVAQRWSRRHRLWLDVRTKAERGDRLARDARRAPAVKAARPPLLDREMDADSAARKVVAHCLAQILPNASEVADGDCADEHVHQLRVGLRRLRSALRFFDGWTTAPDPALAERLTVLFRALGAARDRDALAASLVPALRAAGAPLFALPPPPPGPTPTELLRAVDATQVLLDLLALSGGAAAAPRTGVAADAADAGVPPPQLADAAAARLSRWHRRVVRAGAQYASLSDLDRHTLRKRVKRLRYAAEFMSRLYAAKAVAAYFKALAPVQECLGLYNDVCVALETYRAALDEDPRAWFAIGWLTARREALLIENAAALAALARSKPFWKQP